MTTIVRRASNKPSTIPWEFTPGMGQLVKDSHEAGRMSSANYHQIQCCNGAHGGASPLPKFKIYRKGKRLSSDGCSWLSIACPKCLTRVRVLWMICSVGSTVYDWPNSKSSNNRLLKLIVCCSAQADSELRSKVWSNERVWLS